MKAILFLLVLLGGSALSAQTTLNVKDYGAVPDSGRDATPAFQKAFAAAKATGRPVTLVVPPGVYDFFPAQAHRRKCFTSNSTEPGDDGTKTIALDCVGIKNLTISGPGATMMMRGKMTMFVAQTCQNLTLEGMTFDFKRPTVSEMTAIEKGDDYWIAQVHPDSLYRIKGNQIIWVGEGWESGHNMVQHYDPQKKITWRGGDPTRGFQTIRDLGNRRIRFAGDSKSLQQVVVGRTYQFRNTHRDAVGMWFNRCKNVKLRDIKVRAMHGFGILGQFTENISFKRLVVAPDPKSGRTNASAADVTHFSGCRGLVSITDSVLSAAHDDALNVHGTHLRVEEKTGDHQIKVRFMHAQTRGFQAFFNGDTIDFINADTLLPIARNRVTEVKMLNEREQLLTLEQPVPDSVRPHRDVVENITWTPKVELINCKIQQIPTRGILLTTPQPILVKNNQFFRTQMAAILVADDARSWYESGRIHDLKIQDNLFHECGQSVIRVHPENRTHSGPVHQNLLIEKNRFVLKGNRIADLKSTDRVKFVNNQITMPGGGRPINPLALIGQNHATHVEVIQAPPVLNGLSNGKIWLDQLDLSSMKSGWGQPRLNRSVEGHPLSINGTQYSHGVGTHANSHVILKLDGKVRRFQAVVGVDDEAADRASIRFKVIADGEVLFDSGVMKPNASKTIDVSLVGKKRLTLKVDDAGDGNTDDHADWGDAQFQCDGQAPGALPPQSRWELQPPGAITWPVLEDPDARGHFDHVEMAGQFTAIIVRYGIDSDGTLKLSRHIVWPMLRTIPNNTHASLARDSMAPFFLPSWSMASRWPKKNRSASLFPAC